MARKTKTEESDDLPMMSMDNFEVRVTARTQAVLEHTIKLALCGHSKICSYTETEVHGVKSLLLHWYYRKDQTKFPYEFEVEQIVPFIMGWLKNQDYGPEPDLDGSCSKGWKLFTEHPYIQGKPTNPAWHNVVFAIQPEWAEHHK